MMRGDLICSECNSGVDTENLKCKCSFPNFISKMDETRLAYNNLYKKIADMDIHSSLQDGGNLRLKAQYDRKILKEVSTFNSKLKVLEIGPGLGDLGNLVSSEVDYYCMDIVGNYLELAKGKRMLADVEEIPSAFSQFFDIVIACDVFEHVLNEGNAWIQVNKILKSGGHLYLRVPLNEPLIHYANLSQSIYPFVHLRSYNKRNISVAAYSVGFSVKKSFKQRSGSVTFAKRDFGLKLIKHLNSVDLRQALKFKAQQSENVATNSKLINSKLLNSLVYRIKKNRFLYHVFKYLRFRPNEMVFILLKN